MSVDACEQERPKFHFDSNTKALVIDDAVALDKMLRDTWSPSSMKSVHGCPARWVADRLLPDTDDPFGDAPIGTAGHLVSELLHGMPAEERTPIAAERILQRLYDDYTDAQYGLLLPPAEQRAAWEQIVRERVVGMFIRERFASGDPLAATRVAMWDPGTCNPATRRSQRWHSQARCPDCATIRDAWVQRAAVFDPSVADVVLANGIPDPRTVSVIECERGLSSVVSGVPFFGRIDRTEAVVDPDTGEVLGTRVVDQKTAAKGAKTTEKRIAYGDDHGDQLRLYALALEHADGTLPLEVEIHYSTTGERYRAQLGERDLDRVAHEFRTTWDQHIEYHDKNSYPTVDQKLCEWCPLVLVCPTAKERKRKDNGGHGPRGLKAGIQTHNGPGATPVPSAQVYAARKGESADVSNKTHGCPEHPVTNTATDVQTGNINMVNYSPILTESKSWDTHGAHGLPNANGYGMRAAFSLSSMAVEQAYAAQRGQKDVIYSLTVLFDRIIRDVQVRLSGQTKLEDGLNARLRGALHTVITIDPLPWGADIDTWQTWESRTGNRMYFIAKTATDLHEQQLNLDPYAVLASGGTLERAVEPVSSPEPAAEPESSDALVYVDDAEVTFGDDDYDSRFDG